MSVELWKFSVLEQIYSGRRPGLIQNQKKKSTWSVCLSVCLFVIKKVPPLFSLRKLSKTWKVFSCFVSKKIFFVLNQQESIEQLKDVAEYVGWCFRSLLWQQWTWKRFTKKLKKIIRIFFISIFIEHRICIQIANKFCKHKLFFNN